MTPYEQKQQLIRQDAAFVDAAKAAYPGLYQPVKKTMANPMKHKTRPHRRGWSRIVVSVAEEHGVTLEQILGKSREPRIVHARQHAMYALYATNKYGFAQIGRYLDRDHTAVLHGVAKHSLRTGAPYIGGKVKGRKR